MWPRFEYDPGSDVIWVTMDTDCNSSLCLKVKGEKSEQKCSFVKVNKFAIKPNYKRLCVKWMIMINWWFYLSSYRL